MRSRSERRGFDKIMYEQHVDRVRNVKGFIDCGPPRAHPLGNKAEMDKRRKFAAIEFDNKLLLERLAAVVQTKTIDNDVNEMTKLHTNFKKKLSLTKKKLHLAKISEENQRILKRIQEVPPAYNHLNWEEDARIHERIKRGMALYPEYYEKLDKEAAMRSPGGRAHTPSGRPQSATPSGRIRPSTAGMVRSASNHRGTLSSAAVSSPGGVGFYPTNGMVGPLSRGMDGVGDGSGRPQSRDDREEYGHGREAFLKDKPRIRAGSAPPARRRM